MFYAIITDGDSYTMVHDNMCQNTVTAYAQQLQRSKIPEDPRELDSLLEEIQHRNSSTSMKWPSHFQPDATVCILCEHPLTGLSRVPGSDGKCYIMTRIGVFPVVAFIKKCPNLSCAARYGYCKWDDGNFVLQPIIHKFDLITCSNIIGIFNVSNKLFVTIDILLEMRSHIRRGEPPSNTVNAVFESVCLLSSVQSIARTLTEEERLYLQRKLYDGYFSFEACTKRDWNQSIGGICGIAPVFESGDGNSKNCTPLKRGQVRLPIL